LIWDTCNVDEDLILGKLAKSIGNLWLVVILRLKLILTVKLTAEPKLIVKPEIEPCYGGSY
jgi:hypothetical protein